MKLKRLLLIALCCLSLLGFVACGKDSKGSLDRIEIASQPTKTEYAVGDTFEADGMKINAVYKDKDGKETVADVTQDVTVPSEPLAEGQTYVTVSYTEKDVTKTVNVSVQVKKFVVPETATDIGTIPVSGMEFGCTSGASEAASHWYATYGDSALEIVAIVEDDSLYAGSSYYVSDSVEIGVYKSGTDTGIADGAVKVLADITGEAEITKAADGAYAAFADSGITVRSEIVGFGSAQAQGYRISVTFPYASLAGVTKEGKNATVAFGFTNAVDSVEVSSAYIPFEITDGALSMDQVQTWTKVTADNTFVVSDWTQEGYNFGNAGKFSMTSGWDVSHDDGSEDAYIELKEIVSGTDNNIYMYRSSATNLYAKMSFNAREVKNGEQWGKFGITIFNDGKAGYFFYVDASGNGTNMDGKAVGIAKNSGSGWTGYTNVYDLSDSGIYQGDNFITLEVYRQGAVVKFFVNGTEVSTQGGMFGDNDQAYVGIASFNITLKVKDAVITDDANDLDDYRIVAEQKDYLFLGDSYVDSAFWYTYANDFAGLSSANLGAGGTKIAYWMDMVKVVEALYMPKKIVFHISVNDINDGGANADTVIANLTALFAAYKEAYPSAAIYWVSLCPNNFMPENWTTYQTVNAAVQEMDNVNYIDLASMIGSSAGASVAQYYGTDGLHFNTDGYALWTKAIKEELGIARPTSWNGLGDVSDGAWAYSAGWKVSSDSEAEYIETTGTGEQTIYLTDIKDTSFYASVDLKAVDKTATDTMPKFGIALRSASKTVFFFVDAADASGGYGNTWGNIVTRANGQDWNWGGLLCNQYLMTYKNAHDNFVSFGVVKLENACYFFADGKIFSYQENLFGEDEIVSVSVISFNTNVQAKNVEQIKGTDTQAFNAKLNALKIGEKAAVTLDGDLTDWTEIMKSNPVQIPATDGRSVTVYATMMTDGVYIAYDAIHNTYKTDGAWHEATNAEFKLGGDNQRYVSAMGFTSRYEDNGQRAVGASAIKDTEENGKHHTIMEIFVPYAMIDGYDANSAYIPAGFAFKTLGETGNAWATGDFWYVPEADPGLRNIFITKNGIMTGSEKTIDGDWADWSDASKMTKTMNETDDIELAIYRGSDGIYGIMTVTMASPIKIDRTNVDENWWKNTNFQMFINGKEIRAMFYDGNLYATGRLTQYKGVAENNSITLEFFASFAALGMQADQDVYFKLGGQHFIGDEEANFHTWYWAASDILVITSEGLENGGEYSVVLEKTLDGKWDDWSGIKYVESTMNEMDSVKVAAYKGEMGVYGIATVSMPTISISNDGEWYQKTNFEFHFNNYDNQGGVTGTQWWINIKDDVVSASGFTDGYYKFVYTDGGDANDTITVEFFVPYSQLMFTGSSDKIMMTVGGQHYGGDSAWHAWFWDNNALTVETDGIVGGSV